MNFKNISFNEIEKYSNDLNSIADFLFLNPETAFNEVKAHDLVCDFLEKVGFKVERHFLHNTGFRAIHETSEKPHFAIMVEYDALPEIGHACGHNIICQSSVAAAIGLKAAMDKGLKCKLSVLGTPAEEGGGGKIKFITEGIFNDINVAIMSHPFPNNVINIKTLAIKRIKISFFGKEAHASTSPWEGANALDAAVLAYQGLSCMRQQIHPDYRMHGIISKGGDAANIIPHFTEMKYYVRGPTTKGLNDLLVKVYDCFISAAKMSNCEVKFEDLGPMYEDFLCNKTLNKIFEKNGNDLNVFFTEIGVDLASTDAGNVSHVCPTMHPTFYIGSKAVNHTRQFATDAGKKEAQFYGLLQAKIMTASLIDIASDDTGNVLRNIKIDFDEVKD